MRAGPIASFPIGPEQWAVREREDRVGGTAPFLVDEIGQNLHFLDHTLHAQRFPVDQIPLIV